MQLVKHLNIKKKRKLNSYEVENLSGGSKMNDFLTGACFGASIALSLVTFGGSTIAIWGLRAAGVGTTVGCAFI